MINITKEQAIRLVNSGWWEGLLDEAVVMFQLFEDRLCMPFGVYHKALESCLKRPVYTHEFGLNVEGLQKEFLGKRKAPTMEEIVKLIPEEKRIIVL